MLRTIQLLALARIVIAATADCESNLAGEPATEEICAAPKKKSSEGLGLLQQRVKEQPLALTDEQDEEEADASVAEATSVEEEVAVCTGCIFHTGCDTRMTQFMCELQGGIWRITSEDDAHVEHEIAEMSTLASLDFNEDGQIALGEVSRFLKAMGHRPPDHVVRKLKDRIDTMTLSLAELVPDDETPSVAMSDVPNANFSLVQRQERFLGTIIAIVAVVSTVGSAVVHVAEGGNIIDWVADYIIDTVTDPCTYIPGGKQTKKLRKAVKGLDKFCTGLGHYNTAKDVYGVVFGGSRSSQTTSASRKCHRPGGWCSHKGSLYVVGDCDGDGIPDHFCSDSLHSGFVSSQNYCRDTWPSGQCDGGRRGDGSCSRPSGWCTHGGSSYTMRDCDGDGIADHMCTDNRGQSGYKSSKNGCSDTWPRGRCGGFSGSSSRRSCSRPSGWCTHRGARYATHDCDGDGLADPVCTDSYGQSGYRSSKHGCSDTWPRGRCR